MEDFFALPVIDPRSPVSTAAKTNDRIKKLLDIGCPVFDPFGFSADSKDTAGSFPFERTNLVSANAFGKPDGSGRRNIFA